MTASAPARSAAPSSVASGRGSTFTGAGRLLRFYLRRDRIRIPVWIVAIVLTLMYATIALNAMYKTQAERQSRAELMSSPAAILMSGPGYGTEHYTLGAMIANEMALTLMIAVSIMSILLVVRHTRTEEESGRAELVRAAVVGRHAPLAAAFGAAVIANLAIAVLSGFALVATGLLGAANSFALGFEIGVTGLVFAAVAVVAAQITEHARGASGYALAVLALAWLLSAAGDIEETHGSWLVWLSPIGWAQQIRAFVDLRLWPLGLSALLIIVLLVVGFRLASARDVGAGLRAPRAGRSAAKPSLDSAFALTWRLQRATVAAWAAGIALLGYVCGTFVDSISTMLNQVSADSDLVKQILGNRDPADGFIAIITLYMVIAVGGFAVSSAARGRSEETGERLEVVLAAGVGRSRWLGAQFAVTGLATVGLTLLAGVGLGLGALTVGYPAHNALNFVWATLVYLPALAVVIGVAWAANGWAPRAISAANLFVVYAFVVGLFGTVFKIPGWAKGLSPMYHVPQIPYQAFDAVPLLWLTVVAGVLIGAGFVGFRRRDLGK